ncbi:hypothetical protein F5J12DRAFT_810070 [Pisolithus orientalis]|uniref:uncharacterized protein n=1 Tax=Pisolithus orientalis TaxID=936130 RepID=UPI00222550E9|nr:uncharacterized protein F5J12DRAFT_810070 [Pisolithus orientalis]KAI6025731.1 hypothetical protein F5J12DRAFT_810070 [Pisolithus orientalis]
MRRRNKSHKVPNVKLRPAQTSEYHACDRDTSWPDNSSDSEMAPNASMVDLCPRPFKGVTVCATGQVDKPTLFKKAFELGALSNSDFTDKVTHLIASAHGGPKYMCALERKIPIMTPEWINESHAIWLRGDDVDFRESVSKYRLPVFSGVIMSLSGIGDVDRCAEINRLFTAEQGVYVKNIERPVKVTHLLCSGDVETDKMHYAERFNQRGEASIHLVWEEWFWDCLEFGGRFDERKYHVKRPRPERRSLHGNEWMNRVPRGSERMSTIPADKSGTGAHVDPRNSSDSNPTENLPQVQIAPERQPSQPTFTAIDQLPNDLDEEEDAAIKRTPAVTLHLWQGLLKPRGFELEGGKLVRSPSKSQTRPLPLSTPLPPPRASLNTEAKTKESVLSTFKRAHSFASITKEPLLRQPFRPSTSIAGQGPESAGSSRSKHSLLSFLAYTFRLLGEARCPNVRSAIENGGGVVTDDDTAEVSFIIVRLISGSKLYRDEPDEVERTKYRTECWLEHSVFFERICAPEDNVSFTPLAISTPIPGVEKILLSLSGLDQSELCWIRRLLRALGITIAQTFSYRSTHLLCPSAKGAKFDKALEWRIPVVSMGWLDSMARQGSVPDVGRYLVSNLQNNLVSLPPSGSAEASLRPKVDKGKGREVDVLTGDVTSSKGGFVRGGQFLQPNEDVSSGRQIPAERPGERVSLSLGTMQHSNIDEGQVWFGRPIGLLNGDGWRAASISPRSSPPPRPPPQSSSPPLDIAPIVPEPSPGQLDSGLFHHSPIDLSSQGAETIPSSKSPSPMKLLPSSAPDEAPSTDGPGLGDVAKALEKTLTTLLGKRSSDEDSVPQSRKGKRPRPPPPLKANVRKDSLNSLPSHPRPGLDLEFDSSCYENINLLEVMRPPDESMRVTYEDPVQVEEKRRLMAMLGVETPESGDPDTTGGRKRKKVTRRCEL